MMSENVTRSSKQHFIVWIAAIISVLALAGYFFMRTGQDRKSVGPPEKITIAYSTATDAVLAVVAQVQGYYQQEGLEVTPHLHPYGKRALKEVLEGKADFATVAETPVMFEIMKGEKISVIATIQTSRKDNAIVARKDRGILTVNDLEGRKLAAISGTTSAFFMDALLAEHGISRKEIEVVDLKVEELSDALANGEVDAVSVFNPYIIQAQEKLGDRGISFFEEELFTRTFNIVAKQEFIRNNPEKVKKMLRALIKAEELVREKPAESQKIVADFSRMDIALVRKIWTNNIFGVTLDQSLLLALEDESRWANKSGLTGNAKIPNYLDFIYFDGLESIKPSAVRILR